MGGHMVGITNNRQYLENIPLFRDMAPEDLDSLAGLLKQREYKKDGTILQRDDRGDALFVIAQGAVKVVLYGENGREIILSTLKDGDFFGEMSLLDGAPRSASVISQEPSKILVLERLDFMEQVKQNPKIGLKVMEEMSRRLREADEKIGTLALLDVYGRLARLLMQMAKMEGQKGDEGVTILKRPTHQDIAAMIGTSRETVSRGLGDFARQGLIQMTGKQIFIPNKSLSELEDQSSS
jgi:CRP-like cAMP-binding protein